MKAGAIVSLSRANGGRAPVFICLLGLLALGARGGESTPLPGGAFLIGGTASGLVDGIVLQNNGGDDLGVAADGPFTFATGMADGAAYSVTVSDSGADQLCTVSNASGTIAGASVTDVAVACGAFVATLSGKSQKGPFARGAEVLIQVLNDGLTPTGISFSEATFNNLGHFITNIDIEAPFLEIITTGFYFDEVAGSSPDSISLRSISPYVVGQAINVNLLTQLARGRVRALVITGSSYADALAQAQGEILDIFHVTVTDVADFDTLDFEGASDGSAILIAVSAILMQTAHDRAASDPDIVASELQDLLVGLWPRS